MTTSKDTKIESDGHDLFIVHKGTRIAKRGKPGTKHAKQWISLEPGWRVLDSGKSGLLVEYFGGAVQ
jgi:hypothetical protein